MTRTKPRMPLRTYDTNMAIGTFRPASLISSAMCAAASEQMEP